MQPAAIKKVAIVNKDNKRCSYIMTSGAMQEVYFQMQKGMAGGWDKDTVGFSVWSSPVICKSLPTEPRAYCTFSRCSQQVYNGSIRGRPMSMQTNHFFDVHTGSMLHWFFTIFGISNEPQKKYWELNYKTSFIQTVPWSPPFWNHHYKNFIHSVNRNWSLRRVKMCARTAL